MIKKLILLPNVLGQTSDALSFFSPNTVQAMLQLNGLIAESEKEGRRYLKHFFKEDGRFREIPILLLNEHTKENELTSLLDGIKEGETWGLISDAGLPCIADPGALCVARARERGIIIEAHSGPSSLFLALMLSGLPSQNFTFHGYLPRSEEELMQKIQALIQTKTTHIFIEAPYRNQKLLQTLIQTLPEKALLSVASDLTLPSQEVITLSVKVWRKKILPDLHKRPTVYMISSAMLS